MDELSAREFAALRETIRTRGETRHWAFLAGFSAWAGTLTVLLVWLPNPITATVPLLLLAATFETVRSLHLGVERIGRYLQVFFEERAGADAPLQPPAWERTAMGFGPRLPGAGVHPLFVPLFAMATVLNFLAVVLPGPLPIELTTMAVPHVAFFVWLLTCDRTMRKQRASELERFREMQKG